jgi:hypothetical protein
MSNVRECLERASYCAKLAEEETDPQLRELLKVLANQWIQVAREGATRRS